MSQAPPPPPPPAKAHYPHPPVPFSFPPGLPPTFYSWGASRPGLGYTPGPAPGAPGVPGAPTAPGVGNTEGGPARYTAVTQVK